jgi:excisionase family DNA binding protein
MSLQDELDYLLVLSGHRKAVSLQPQQPRRTQTPSNGNGNGIQDSGIIEKLLAYSRPITAKELADLLHVSHLTILRKAKRGIIPSFKVGSLVRFNPKEVAEWLRRSGIP